MRKPIKATESLKNQLIKNGLLKTIKKFEFMLALQI